MKENSVEVNLMVAACLSGVMEWNMKENSKMGKFGDSVRKIISLAHFAREVKSYLERKESSLIVYLKFILTKYMITGIFSYVIIIVWFSERKTISTWIWRNTLQVCWHSPMVLMVCRGMKDILRTAHSFAERKVDTFSRKHDRPLKEPETKDHELCTRYFKLNLLTLLHLSFIS